MNFNDKVEHLQVTDNHVWGNYKQIIVNDNIVLRAIRIYANGMNSLHKHDVEELMIVESGSIDYHYIPQNSHEVEVRRCAPGDVIYVKKQTPHRIEFVSGDFEEKGIQFAQLYEICLGDNKNGNYTITRLEQARPGTIKP